MLFKKHKSTRQRLFGSCHAGGAIWELGYILALLGGIVIIAVSFAALVHYTVNLPFLVPLVGYFGIGVISLILGAVAVFGSKRVDELIWGVVLMAVGLLTGGIGGSQLSAAWSASFQGTFR